jgi:hypothetical protein
MSQQTTNAPHRQPTRKRVQRVVQQHQPQPHSQRKRSRPLLGIPAIL